MRDGRSLIGPGMAGAAAHRLQIGRMAMASFARGKPYPDAPVRGARSGSRAGSRQSSVQIL